MREELIGKYIKTLKRSMPEKTIVEYFLNSGNHERKVTSIGYVKDIDSNFKNDIFEEIFEDEYGNIVDLRICEEKPTRDEMDEMVEYWAALTEKFNKLVQPCFVITGGKSDDE